MRRFLPTLTTLLVVSVVLLGASPRASAQSTLLTRASFKLAAEPGFGERGNTWAWSSEWFNNRMYFGTGRWVSCYVSTKKGTYPIPADRLIECPPTITDLAPQMGGQIWSADPSGGYVTQSDWRKEYESPITIPMAISGTDVLGPRDVAYRGMSVYTESDGSKTLYASGVSVGLDHVPPSLMGIDEDGNAAAVPSDPGTVMGEINRLRTTYADNIGLRASVQMGDTFYIVTTDDMGSGTLFASQNPSQGNNSFRQITPKNMPVWEIIPFNGHLYIGLASWDGYSVVRTDCIAPPPGKYSCPPEAFTTVIPPGAGIEENANNNVESMEVYTDPLGQEYLYVGAGITPLTNTHGAELTRIHPDDSWDVVVGAARTVDGVEKQPLSGIGEGFGFQMNKYMWRMAVYNGSLYIGTYNIGTSVFINRPAWNDLRNVIGCNLWGSADGVTFRAITRNGFGDPYCEGIRSMTATPHGLFIGTVSNWTGTKVWQGR